MSAKGWIILAIFFVIGIFAYDFLTKKPERRMPIAVSKEAVGSWKEYEAEDRSFKVKFPTKPQHVTTTDEAMFGDTKDKVVYHVYAAQDVDGTTFLVKEIHYPEAASIGHEEVLFDDVVTTMLQNNPNSKLKESKKGSFLTHNTREFVIEAPNATLQSRAFLVDKTLFVLTVTEKNAEHIETDFNNFASSFQLGAR